MQKTKDLTPLDPSFNHPNKHCPGLVVINGCYSACNILGVVSVVTLNVCYSACKNYCTAQYIEVLYKHMLSEV